MSPLNRNLESLRKRLGYSQENVAQFLNVSHTIISNYETGKYEPTHEHLTKLADLYGVDIVDLFSEDVSLNNYNLAFAFRADTLKAEDLESISKFKKIIKNYLVLKSFE
jgi:transcriptional regulator with XRE-family HTH domain